MSGLSFSPRFVRASVTFKFSGMTQHIPDCLINTAGLPPVPWKTFDPQANLGQRVAVTVKVLTSTNWEFTCDALISTERVSGKKESALGLIFLFKPGDRARLDASVAAEGVLPDYVRKLPRIHFQQAIAVFPSKAIVKFFYNQEDISVACDIDNLSPTGIMVVTDDSRTNSLKAEETVRVQIQPRGVWLKAVAVNAQVKRVTEKVDPATGNVVRAIGLGITTISAEAKNNFTELLRQIVQLSKIAPKSDDKAA